MVDSSAAQVTVYLHTIQNHVEMLGWGSTPSKLALDGYIFGFVFNEHDSVVRFPKDQTEDSFVAAFSRAVANKDINFVIRAMECDGKKDRMRRQFREQMTAKVRLVVGVLGN